MLDATESRYAAELCELGFEKLRRHGSSEVAGMMAFLMDDEPDEKPKSRVPVITDPQVVLPAYTEIQFGNRYITLAYDEHGEVWTRHGEESIELEFLGFSKMFERHTTN